MSLVKEPLIELYLYDKTDDFNKYRKYRDGQFVCEVMEMKKEVWRMKFGLFDHPRYFLHKKYGWNFPDRKVKDLSEKYQLLNAVYFIHAVADTDGDLAMMSLDYLLNYDMKSIPSYEIRKVFIAVREQEITKNDMKEIISRMVAGEKFDVIIKEDKWKKLDDITPIVRRVFDANLETIRESKDRKKIKNWLVGQVMKETKGACDPVLANVLINNFEQELDNSS